MKLKKVFCNTNILVLFLGFKLATKTQEIKKPSKNSIGNLSNVSYKNKIKALQRQFVKTKKLRSNFFPVMLKFLNFITNVGKTELVQETKRYYLLSRIYDAKR